MLDLNSDADGSRSRHPKPPTTIVPFPTTQVTRTYGTACGTYNQACMSGSMYTTYTIDDQRSFLFTREFQW